MHESVPDLAAAVRRRADAIIARLAGETRRLCAAAGRLPAEALGSTARQILNALCDTLAHPDHLPQLHEMAGLHGLSRFQADFALKDLLAEIRLLRQAMAQETQAQLQRALTPAEDGRLDLLVDLALEASITAFSRQSAERLASAAGIESKYYSYLSHDLRNNLNAMMLNLEALKLRIEPEPQCADAIIDIEAAQRAISETIAGMDRLLAAERDRHVSGGRRQAVGLLELASDLVRQFGNQAMLKGLSLKLEIEPGLSVPGDRECLRIVLQNLVGNAIKYSSAGTITVRADKNCGPNGRVLLSVSDHGPGIPADQLARIFDRHARGESCGEPGFGLGLAIAARAADLLGGELRAQSIPGTGSTFTLSLPV